MKQMYWFYVEYRMIAIDFDNLDIFYRLSYNPSSWLHDKIYQKDLTFYNESTVIAWIANPCNVTKKTLLVHDMKLYMDQKSTSQVAVISIKKHLQCISRGKTMFEQVNSRLNTNKIKHDLCIENFKLI